MTVHYLRHSSLTLYRYIIASNRYTTSPFLEIVHMSLEPDRRVISVPVRDLVMIGLRGGTEVDSVGFVFTGD